MGNIPLAADGEHLQSYGERIYSERLAIDDAGAGAKAAEERADIELFVEGQGFAGHDTCSMGADIFRETFLSVIAHVEAGDIDGNSKRDADIQTTNDRIHRTPGCLPRQTGRLSSEDWVATERIGYSRKGWSASSSVAE